MCSQNQLQYISDRIVACYRDAFGNDLQEVILYGSYARGDYDQESDIDYTAIVSGERIDLQHKMESIWDSSAELGLENAIAEAKRISRDPDVRGYDNMEDLKAALESD